MTKNKKPNGQQYIEHLSQKDQTMIMISIPIAYGGDSLDMEIFLDERGKKVNDVEALGADFKEWYRKIAPDEFNDPAMARFKLSPPARLND